MLKFAIKRKTLELFHEAVDNKDFLRTKLLIENCDKQKFVVDSLDANGLTPLQRSCFLGNVRIVRLLVEAGANVSIKDSEGWTVLHAASVAGNYAVVKYLMKIGVNLEAKTDRGELALDLAEKDNVVLLLAKGMIRKGLYTYVRGYFKQNPKTFQRIIDDLKKKDKLQTSRVKRSSARRPRTLELPKMPNESSTDDPEANTPPQSPAEESEPPRGTFRRSLRGRRPTPPQPRPIYDDPLSDDDELDHDHVIPLSPSWISSSMTSLSSVSSSSSVPSSHFDWPDVIYAAHRSTRTSSSSCTSPTSTSKCVKFVVPVGSCDVSSGSVKQVNKWIDTGKIELNSLNQNGVAPMHQAAFANNVAVVELLLRRGADINKQSSDGCTPIHAAVQGGSSRAVALLIDYGADLFIENDNGALPIEETENESIIAILQQAMSVS
jgi:ankyrin repeat protein